MDFAEFFRVNFYWVDFTIAATILIVVSILYKTKRLERFSWILYWIGVGLGILWELPMSVANEIGIYPPARFLTPLPVHFSVVVITHSLWDGGLLLAGVWFVHRFSKEPYFKKFKISELAILLIWGQLSELAVELTSTFSNAWEYISYWWNPTLFFFNGHNITLLPQIIWLVAPIIFYLIALKLKKGYFQT